MNLSPANTRRSETCLAENSRTPTSRTFLTAQWRHLALLNFEFDPRLLQAYVPRGVELDFHEGRTFASLVGFRFLDTRLFGAPIPFHRNFEELNLRIYVRREEPDGVRRGVVFVKELVPRLAVACVARWAYNENYFCAPMRHAISGVDLKNACTTPCPDGASVAYRWKSAGRWDELRLDVRGVARQLVAGSHQEFILEHYWGYARQRDGGTAEYRVEHPPWNVWSDCEARLSCDVARLYPREFAKTLQAAPASAFLADGSAVSVARPRRLP